MWVPSLGPEPILRTGVPLTPILVLALAAVNREAAAHAWLQWEFQVQSSRLIYQYSVPVISTQDSNRSEQRGLCMCSHLSVHLGHGKNKEWWEGDPLLEKGVGPRGET